MALSTLDYLAAAGAAALAGAINALAGGGTLVSFPTLVGLGVPSVAANVTNAVALLPGYLAGTWAQRDDLRPQLAGAWRAAVIATAGGLAGSILLVAIPPHAFRVVVPYLIVMSCVLLVAQDRLRRWLWSPPPAGSPGGDPPAGDPPAGRLPAGHPRANHAGRGAALLASVFVASIYGGFFGAGLGIMLLAILGVFSSESLVKLNALKQLLSFGISIVAAVFFAFSGHVRWQLVPVMAAASLVGGAGGGRLVRVIPGVVLRRIVVVVGLGVAVAFWVA